MRLRRGRAPAGRVTCTHWPADYRRFSVHLRLQKWGCFSCASPFSCRQRSGVLGDSDDDGEVVRRNDGPSPHAGPLSPLPPVESEGEEFVIRKGSLSRLGGGSPASSGRGSAGRVK